MRTTTALLGIAMFLGSTVWSQEQRADRVDHRTSVYPGATPVEHPAGRYTLRLTARAGYANASAFSTPDSPEKVLTFYRDHLRSFGRVIECSDGTNRTTDVEINENVIAEPLSCFPETFASGGTLLKVFTGGDQRIVVVLPKSDGAEFALVQAGKETRR